MSSKLVYLDHNATTPVADEVQRSVGGWVSAWGNPSSIHGASRGPKQILRESRQVLAELLHVSPLELIFTSGGSESNSAVLKSAWWERKPGQTKLIVSAVEHPSLLKTAQWLATQGADVVQIAVNRQGQLDLEHLKAELDETTFLVSIMSANNETGTLFPLQEITRWAHAQGIPVHTDAVQILGKLPLDLHELGVDYASFSAHKFYALKGCGLLYVRKGQPFQSLILGGGQERHRRGGTENILGIAAFGCMAHRRDLIARQGDQIAVLRDHFEARVLEEIPEITLTASETPRLPNTSSLVIRGVDGETLLMGLDLKGFAVSTGAACSSGNPEPSPVLLAMGLSRSEAQNSLRVSLGWNNTLQEINDFVETLKQVVFRLRSISQSAEAHHGR